MGRINERCRWGRASAQKLFRSWEAQLDDLNTGEEVDTLKGVFRNIFRYTVVKKQLVSGKQYPQIQVQKILVDFVYEFDENTLLIVYYAGHRVPGKQSGESLLLQGYMINYILPSCPLTNNFQKPPAEEQNQFKELSGMGRG
jgi:hypothetical protein